MRFWLLNACATCEEPIGGPRNFRSDDSRSEFLYTGLCQACQDAALDEKMIRTIRAYTAIMEPPLNFERKQP